MSFHFIFVINFIRNKNPLYGISVNMYIATLLYLILLSHLNITVHLHMIDTTTISQLVKNLDE